VVRVDRDSEFSGRFLARDREHLGNDADLMNPQSGEHPSGDLSLDGLCDDVAHSERIEADGFEHEPDVPLDQGRGISGRSLRQHRLIPNRTIRYEVHFSEMRRGDVRDPGKAERFLLSGVGDQADDVEHRAVESGSKSFWRSLIPVKIQPRLQQHLDEVVEGGPCAFEINSHRRGPFPYREYRHGASRLQAASRFDPESFERDLDLRRWKQSV